MIKGDTVIVDRGSIGHRREISTDPTNGECNKSKPFDRTDGEPLDVTEGDGECENLSVFDVQVNIHHVGDKLVMRHETRRDLLAYVIVSFSDFVSQASRVNGFSFTSPILARYFRTLVGNSMPTEPRGVHRM